MRKRSFIKVWELGPMKPEFSWACSKLAEQLVRTLGVWPDMPSIGRGLSWLLPSLLRLTAIRERRPAWAFAFFLQNEARPGDIKAPPTKPVAATAEWGDRGERAAGWASAKGVSSPALLLLLLTALLPPQAPRAAPAHLPSQPLLHSARCQPINARHRDPIQKLRLRLLEETILCIWCSDWSLLPSIILPQRDKGGRKGVGGEGAGHNSQWEITARPSR